LNNFEYRSHLCLVLEPMSMNLREVIKKYGKDIGISISAVKIYAKQLFSALKHMKACGVIHGDIKPDNIVINSQLSSIKLCDFGSACYTDENEITPYLVSRFYRAPEIMLGLPYDTAIDMWSVGCCLIEMYTGKILFQGKNNNDMLKQYMELKGKIPKKLLQKATFKDQRFDEEGNFLRLETDPITGKNVIKVMPVIDITRDLDKILKPTNSKLDDETIREVSKLKDLLDRIFVADPSKRLTIQQAILHPFIAKNPAPA